MDSDTTTYTLDVAGGLPHVIVETTGSDSDLYLTGLAQFQNDAWAYQHPDGLGSIRQLTDSSVQVTLAQTYDPFGNLLEQSGNGSSGFGYTGEQEDASTGLVFLRARYYDPAVGRFISKDTFSGFTHQPGTQHPYVYVTNNPFKFVDPTGQAGECVQNCVDLHENPILEAIFQHFCESTFSEAYTWDEFLSAFQMAVVEVGDFDPNNSEVTWAIAHSMANTLEGPGPHSGMLSPEVVFFAFFAQDTLLWQAFGEVVDQRTETLGAVLLGSFFGGTYFSPDGGGGGNSKCLPRKNLSTELAFRFRI